ncbi:MAG TPA: hypothetical protein VMG14_04425 [Thermoplasmata archaeon]|nr:hypothetical protein [Thermoplasmata archaeon]
MSGTPAPPVSGRIDGHGHYHVRAEVSYVTVGVYAFMILLLFLVLEYGAALSYPWGIEAVILITAFFLARYLSTHYVIDDTYLRASRIAGGSRIRLEDVRKIEFVRLRDLSPTGIFGSWGWRGRMWSPRIGAFDAVYADPNGVLVTGGAAPLFVSPRDPEDFARELSRRVRSYTGPLAVDAGNPAG